MNPIKTGLMAATTLCAAAVLSACGIQSAATGVCPKIGVLPDAADLPVRNSNGEVVALGRLSLANSSCVYDTSRRAQTGFGKMTTILTVRVAVVAQPAARFNEVKAPFVVATIAPDGVVTGREVYETEVDISSGRRGTEDEKLTIVIPFEGADASGHRIVVAFRLGDADLKLNRSRVGR